MEPENYSKPEKSKIINNNFGKISNETAIADFLKLRKITNPCSGEKNTSNYGSKIINKFTLLERFSTKSRKKFSFFDLYYNREYLIAKPYINRLYQYRNNSDSLNFPKKKKNPHWNDAKFINALMGIYFSRPSIFRPIIAMQIYCMFKPTSILDMTMGWGGRMVGACALDIKKYTGIDLNKNLEIPYKHMKKMLEPLCNTEMVLYFGDALKFNYTDYYYDLVLTSPPYYNIETYGTQKARTKDEWNNDFYIPLITKSFNGLSYGGHYCLNIPIYIYEDVAVPLLGIAHQQIPLTRVKRRDPNAKKTYKEYIYVWKKL